MRFPFWRRKRRDEELNEEIQAHLTLAEREEMESGQTRKEAQLAARHEFGNVVLAAEVTRDMWGWRWLMDLVQDLRFGMRMLRKTPGFTAVAVLTLSLGIGANTAIFTLINAVLLRNLPVKDPEQLVLLNWAATDFPKAIQSLHGKLDGSNGRTTSTSFSYPVFEKFATQKDLFSQVFGFAAVDPASVRINGNTSIAEVDVVTGGFFSALGIAPILGRTISDADEEPGVPPVAVISGEYWRTAFGGDPAAVGESVVVNGFVFTVVGVAPAEFFGVQPGRAVELWVPTSTAPRLTQGWANLTARENWWLPVMARVKPGVSETQARAALDVLLAQETTAGITPPPKPGEIPHSEFTAASRGLNDLRQQFSKPLQVLMMVVALVLLIACANVANLLLARAAGRGREIAIRLAIGAGRGRMVRQLLAESILLAAAGAVLGSFLAVWGTRVLVLLITNPSRPIEIALGVDTRVLLFTVLLSAGTPILFGLAPALRAIRVELQAGLKENAGSEFGAKFRLRKILVVAQTAISVVLLVGAGLFVHTLVKLKNQDLGFNAANVLTFRLDPQLHGYAGPRILAFYEDVLGRIKALPGVESASLAAHRLMASANTATGVSAEGVPPETTKNVAVSFNSVSPDFLRTMQIKTVLGRGIEQQDGAGFPKIAVVNQALASRFFGKLDPVGRWISFGGQPGKTSEQITIVGVTTDAKYSDIHEPPPPTIYLSFQQSSRGLRRMDFEIRAYGEPKALANAVRQVVRDVDKDVPVENELTQTEQIDASLLQERMFAKLVSFFGGLALVLACIGLYGVMAYVVVQRTHEIGIRKALGAQPGSVLGMILRESLLLVATGAGLGLLGAYFSTRLIASFLFQLKPNDPVALVSAIAALGIVGCAAVVLPSRRAMRVDPMVALRYE